MVKMKVHLKAHRHIYIHNDIGNATFYFKNRVDERIAKDDRDGVGLEIIAGLFDTLTHGGSEMSFIENVTD